uniref:Protein kinase domain-containing protein n=2 Tax=Parascaris univalens TaxID=6257 RepID=A0A914ZY83_PARUN
MPTVIVSLARQPGVHTELHYSNVAVIGRGSFGMVHLAILTNSGEAVAIKKVLQDGLFKHRKLLQIVGVLDHRNVVQLKSYFYSHGANDAEVYLNLILEYIPEMWIMLRDTTPDYDSLSVLSMSSCIRSSFSGH